MPRGKTRARLRAARPPFGDSTDPMDDDSGRTPARVDYIFRDIGRRLRMARERDEALALARARASEPPSTLLPGSPAGPPGPRRSGA